MGRFDVYTNRQGAGWLLDVQSDLIASLNTRVVVPLLPVDEAPLPAERLNPVFAIEGARAVMLTQFMAAVPASELRAVVSSLDREANAILAAIDFLHQGW